MDEGDDRVGAAEELAREVAPDLDAILVTIYPDADTLDTIRPGDADVAAANAVARAVAGAMSEEGVEVFVQRADRGAFRRWLADREDTPEVRRSWVDRGRLLRGISDIAPRSSASRIGPALDRCRPPTERRHS